MVCMTRRWRGLDSNFQYASEFAAAWTSECVARYALLQS
jgi:hypothetical protein